MAATRIVQNVLSRPGAGDLLTGRQVSIQANCPMFVNGGAEEIERTSYVTTDPVTALWQAVLVVNSDADVQPANTYYTVREMPGVIWTFAVPPGDPAVPVNLFDCLVSAPTNPTPIVAPDVSSFVSFGATPPAGPTLEQVWIDTSTPPPVLKYWDGTAWVAFGSSSGPSAATTSPSLMTSPTLVTVGG